jgi:hypothetical protein
VDIVRIILWFNLRRIPNAPPCRGGVKEAKHNNPEYGQKAGYSILNMTGPELKISYGPEAGVYLLKRKRYKTCSHVPNQL